MSHHPLSRPHALGLLLLVVTAWGVNWPITRMLVQDMSPLWATALRCVVAAAFLGPLLWLRGEFIVPKRGDVPVVLTVALLHMGAYSVLVAAGLQFLPAGRGIVLGYTTPIWVAFGARIFLAESIGPWKSIGLLLGLGGLALVFSPASLDWNDRGAVIGSGLILFAAFCWAANILYVRAHRWVSSPFQLVFWQVLLACIVLSCAALLLDGLPSLNGITQNLALLLFSGVVCTALAHWAMTVVNRSLPALTTSLGLLATPVLGIISSALFLGEALELPLVGALILLVGGIAIGILGDAQRWGGSISKRAFYLPQAATGVRLPGVQQEKLPGRALAGQQPDGDAVDGARLR